MKLTRRQLRLIIEQEIKTDTQSKKYFVLSPMGKIDHELANGLQDQISAEAAKYLGAKNELNRDNISRYIRKNNLEVVDETPADISESLPGVYILHANLNKTPSGEAMRIKLSMLLNGEMVSAVSGKLSGVKAGKIAGSIEHKSDQELAKLIKSLMV